MPLPSTWIALVSCPPMSSTVRVAGKSTWAPRPWQRISDRICSFGNGRRARPYPVPTVAETPRSADRAASTAARTPGVSPARSSALPMFSRKPSSTGSFSTRTMHWS